MRLSYIFPAALILAASTFSAHAGTITYTESGYLSGSLGRHNFLDDLVTITGTGDSASVVNEGGGTYTIVLPTELTVAGLSSTTFTDTIQFFVNDTNRLAGVGDNTTDSEVLGTLGSAFSNYNLQSSIGPITGEASFNPGFAFGTGLGSFDITGGDYSTFKAVATSSPVPEPSTLALLGTGILGLAGMARRKFFNA